MTYTVGKLDIKIDAFYTVYNILLAYDRFIPSANQYVNFLGHWPWSFPIYEK